MAISTTVRPAEVADLPSIAAIHSYYVLNTVVQSPLLLMSYGTDQVGHYVHRGTGSLGAIPIVLPFNHLLGTSIPRSH
jgi:hypothetical protein